MASVGGSATTSTGHVKQHATHPPTKQAAGSAGRNRVGGKATVATGKAADSARSIGKPTHRNGTTKNPVKGGTTATARVKQHVSRAAKTPGVSGSPYPKAGSGR